MDEHWIMEDADKLRAWIKILIHVNHSPAKVLIADDLIEVKPGQSVKSKGTWAKIFGKGWDRHRVKRFFKLLEKDGIIAQRITNKTTILSVCNWETYQNQRSASDQQTARRVISKRSASDQQTLTNNNDNKENNELTMREQGNKQPVKTQNDFPEDPPPQDLTSRPLESDSGIQSQDSKTKLIDKPKGWVEAQFYPEIRVLKAKGCKLGPNNWEVWLDLVARFGVNTVLKSAQDVLPSNRWPDKVEEKLSATDNSDNISKAAAIWGEA